MSKETTPQELYRAYQREWRAKNKKKVRQYNKDYWQRKAEKMNAERSGKDETDKC